MAEFEQTGSNKLGPGGANRIRDCMSAPVQTIEAGATIYEAAVRMKEKSVGSLLVADGNRYTGIVTRTDLAARVVAAGIDPRAHRIGEIMSSPIIFIHPDASLEEADQLMGAHRIGHLVAGNADSVAGIVSVRNLVLYFMDTQHEMADRRGYVRLPFTALVRYKGSDRKEYHSLTYDINGGGIFIQTDKPFPVGSRIEIEMVLPSGGPVVRSKGIVSWMKNAPMDVMKAEGQIVYVKRQRQKVVVHPGGMGVRFTQISDNDKVAVMEFVTEIMNRISPAPSNP